MIQNLTLLSVFLFPFSCVVAVREPRDRRRFRPDAREINGRPRTTKHVVRPAQRPRQHERGARGRRQSQWYVVVVLWRWCDCDVVVIVMLLGCDFRSITDQRLTRYFAFFLLDLFSVLCRHQSSRPGDGCSVRNGARGTGRRWTGQRCSWWWW